MACFLHKTTRDYPARLDVLLAGHEGALSSIDPDGTSLECADAAKPTAEPLEHFIGARSTTVARLRAHLGPPGDID